MSTDTNRAATEESASPSEYPEKFVTHDAVYTLHSLAFVPSSTPDVGSLFDDSPDDIQRTWNRAQQVGVEISSADEDEVERRLVEARKTVSGVLRKLENRTAPSEAESTGETS
jgi:hypothetical protein